MHYHITLQTSQNYIKYSAAMRYSLRTLTPTEPLFNNISSIEYGR